MEKKNAIRNAEALRNANILLDRMVMVTGIIARELYWEDSFVIPNLDSKLYGPEDSQMLIPFLPLRCDEEGLEKIAGSLKKAVSNLSYRDRLACIVPSAFLNAPQSKDVRKMLTEEKLLDKVLLLAPAKSFDEHLQLAILFLKKDCNTSVKFVDDWDDGDIDYATSALLTYDKRPTEQELRDEGLMFNEDFFDFWFDPDFEKHTDKANFGDIASHEYNLTPTIYIEGKLPYREGYHLTDGDFFVISGIDDYDESVWGANPGIVKFGDIEFQRDDEQIAKKRKFKKGAVTGKVVDQSELREFSSYASHLDVATIKSKTYEGIYYELQGKAVIIPLIGSFKPTFVETTGDEIVYIPLADMCFLKPSASFDLEYVANELCKDYVKRQLRYEEDGRLSEYDLEYLRIYLPDDTDTKTSLECQQEIVREERQTHIQMLEAELGIERRELHLRKHRLANLLAQVKDGFDLLDLVRQEQGGILRDSDMLNACIEENVGQYFKQIQKSINKVAGLVSHFIDEQSPILERVSLRKFLEEFKNEYPKKNYKMDLLFDMPEDSLCIVNVDKDMLHTGLENIARNAEMHGFIDSEREDYCLRIRLSEKEADGQHYFVLLVANNGSPMDKSVEKDKIFEWGYGAHTGLGMWELKKTIEHFGGKLKLQEEPSDIDFPVEYEILLPKV